MLAEKTPAGFVAFDLLALGDTSYVDRPFSERRAAMEEALGRPAPALLPDPDHHRPGRGRGVVPPVRGRRPGRRGRQAADRAVPAERPHHAEDQARAHRRRGRRRATASTRPRPRAAAARAACCSACTPTASCSTSASRASFTEKRRAELIEELQPLVVPDRGAPVGRVAGVGDRQPRPGAGHPEPVERGQGPVVHAAAARSGCSRSAYDHMEGRRFRHTAQFRRWRPDRDPESCGYEQLEEPVSYDLARILGRTTSPALEAIAMS